MKSFIGLLLLLVFAAAVFGQTGETTAVKIYFLNEKFDTNLEDCRKVHAVTRMIPKTNAIAKTALEELF